MENKELHIRLQDIKRELELSKINLYELQRAVNRLLVKAENLELEKTEILNKLGLNQPGVKY